MADAEQENTPLTSGEAMRAVGIALAAGIVLVFAPGALVWLLSQGATQGRLMGSVGLGLTVLCPLVQGVVLGFALGARKVAIVATVGLGLALLLIELALAAAVLREGVICLLIIAPLYLLLILAGAWIGRVLARRRPGKALQASAVPLIVLAAFGAAAGPKPDATEAVIDSVIVQAPPDYVWRYVATYPENTAAPDYWLWRIGLPYPVQSVAEVPAVGAKRVCAFSDGVAFEERITEFEPNARMTFVVTRQPDHPEVTGHFQFDTGRIELTANADGTTTVTATSWYRMFVRPAGYFSLWTADITRQIHFRVLGHMKALAEADYRAAQARTE